MNELTNLFGQWYEVQEYDAFKLYVTLWNGQFRVIQGFTWTFKIRFYEGNVM